MSELFLVPKPEKKRMSTRRGWIGVADRLAWLVPGFAHDFICDRFGLIYAAVWVTSERRFDWRWVNERGYYHEDAQFVERG